MVICTSTNCGLIDYENINLRASFLIDLTNIAMIAPILTVLMLSKMYNKALIPMRLLIALLDEDAS